MSKDDIVVIDEDAPAAVEATLPRETVMSLKYPIKASFKRGGATRDEHICELTIRRLKGGDLIELDRIKDEMAQLSFLFKALTGLPENVFRDMDAEDVLSFGKVVKNFMPQSQGTGTTS